MSQAENLNLKIEVKPRKLDLAFIAFAEFTGTAILLFLSCMGNTGIQGDISSMHKSFNSGLAVMVAIQIFGHISGAHVNPVVTLSALILNKITPMQVPVYVIPQILGCLVGVTFQVLVTPKQYVDITGGHGVCVTAPHADITDWQALAIEAILTTILVFTICASWDLRNSDKMDSVALKIGLVVGVLNLAATAYTGASMNPVRSFGPAIWGNDYTAHWVYWVGPTIGSVLATYTYKYAFLKKY